MSNTKVNIDFIEDSKSMLCPSDYTGGGYGLSDAEGPYYQNFLMRAVRNNYPLYDVRKGGRIENEGAFWFGIGLIVEDLDKCHSIGRRLGQSSVTIVTENSFMEVKVGKDKRGTVDATFLCKRTAERVFEWCEKNLLKSATKNALHVITQTKSGYDLSIASPDAGTKLTKENYSEQVLSEFEKAVACIQSKTPRGRLTIIDGPPGTGKSWLVRGLINAAPRGKFIHCSAKLATELDGPNLITLFLNDSTGGGRIWNHEEGEYVEQHEPPKVLIIEDGDACLVQRGSDNMSSIQAVLNYADGILGDAMDFRIVVTTNAEHLLTHKKDSIDPALLRPGRLAARIQILPHELEQADAVLKSLLPKKQLSMKDSEFGKQTKGSAGFGAAAAMTYTLAEIYEFAYANGLE